MRGNALLFRFNSYPQESSLSDQNSQKSQSETLFFGGDNLAKSHYQFKKRQKELAKKKKKELKRQRKLEKNDINPEENSNESQDEG